MDFLSGHVSRHLECFHTRADWKLQWRIVIAIFELPSVHMREKTSLSGHVSRNLACFHMRADSKSQWRIVIAIFELPSVHMREKTSVSLWFSIPEWGEETWLFLCVLLTCWLLFNLKISIRKCAVYRRKWLEGHIHV